eukprot:1871565-Amphidinium_carterae.1
MSSSHEGCNAISTEIALSLFCTPVWITRSQSQHVRMALELGKSASAKEGGKLALTHIESLQETCNLLHKTACTSSWTSRRTRNACSEAHQGGGACHTWWYSCGGGAVHAWIIGGCC